MMKKNISHLLKIAQNMIEEEKISECLEYLISLEPVDQYTDKHKAIFYTLKSKINRFLGNFTKAYEIAEKGMQFANKIEKGVEMVDAFLNMARIIHFMGKNRECSNLLKESYEILTNSTQISEKDRNRRLGLYYFYKGNNLVKLGKPIKAVKENIKHSIDLLEKWGPQASLARSYAGHGLGCVIRGEFNKGLIYIDKSQKICEHKESPQYRISKMLNLFSLGAIYWNKGELQSALENIKKGVSSAQTYKKPIFKHMGLNALGKIYYELGEWDQAIKYYKEAINLAENIDANKIYMLSNILNLYATMGDLSTAPHIFQKIEQYQDRGKDDKWFSSFYRFNKALLLKQSKRTRDLGAAQEIFKNIAHEEVTSLEMAQLAILNLCEMLLDEFKDTQNVEVLEELTPLLTRLRKVAKKRHSFKILAESYILSAKLSMIKFDFKTARQSLTQAQQIAEKTGLKRLAIKISNEHDNLLKNLEVFAQMKEDNVPISERLEKIEINSQISTSGNKKTEDPPKLSPESPILLLIMAKSGIPLYTKIFNKEWKINEELFSGFLSAFNTFSSEIFSEGLDRACFGKFTILMTGMPPFMSCYVFEGQSFLANQKFLKFNETIHETETIWKILTSSDRTGQVIKDNASGGLEELVKTIFQELSA
ncbi:MAG: tetratricopeptide repeat protein [Promethearchaeota archaeon]